MYTSSAEELAVLKEARVFLAMVQKGYRSRLAPPGWLKEVAWECQAYLIESRLGKFHGLCCDLSPDYTIARVQVRNTNLYKPGFQWPDVAKWLGVIADRPIGQFEPESRPCWACQHRVMNRIMTRCPDCGWVECPNTSDTLKHCACDYIEDRVRRFVEGIMAWTIEGGAA